MRTSTSSVSEETILFWDALSRSPALTCKRIASIVFLLFCVVEARRHLQVVLSLIKRTSTATRTVLLYAWAVSSFLPLILVFSIEDLSSSSAGHLCHVSRDMCRWRQSRC